MIDQQLLAIKPPVELTRVPCSVKEWKHLKASEWKSFLLFYAIPVLSGILSKKYLNHPFLLVFGIYTLLQENIQIVDIDNAEKALKIFFMEFEKSSSCYPMQKSKQETAKSSQLSENVRVFGNSNPVNVPVWHMLGIEELFGVRVQQYLYYGHFLVDSVLYH